MFRFDYTFIQDIYSGLIDSEAVFISITSVKAIGLAVLIIHWYTRYIQSTEDKEKSLKGLSPYDLLRGFIIIGLLVSYDYLLEFFDQIMNFIENQYAGFQTDPRFYDLEDNGIQKGLSGEAIKLISDPLYIIMLFLKVVAWGLDLMIYGIFLSARFFFLGVLRVLGALALAFYPIPELSKWFWNWLGLYVATYLLIIPYILVNAFTKAIYDSTWEIVSSLPMVKITELVMVIPLCFVVILKIILYVKSSQILYRIFT